MRQDWKTLKLADIADVFEDGDWIESKNQSSQGIRLIQTGNVGNGFFKDRGEKARYISYDTFAKLRCTEIVAGDCLVSRLPDPVGRACILPETMERMITAVDCTIIRFNKSNVLPEWFVFYSLSNEYSVQIERQVSGATRQRISRKNLGNIEVPLPSLPEQKRIVAILDSSFAAIDKAKANIEKNLENVKELFISYLNEMFESNDKGWVNTTIGETCNLQTGGTPNTNKSEYYKDGKIKWLVSGDINQKFIFDCDGRITELGLNNSNARYLPVNSVLIALNGQGKTRGTVAMLKTMATCNQSLVSIYPKDDKALLPELIFSNLEGRYDEIRRMTGDSGNDRRGLNMQLIRSIKFSFPKNIKEQERIIKRLDTLRDESLKLEYLYRKKLLRFKELKESILHKAFTGELTPATKTFVA